MTWQNELYKAMQARIKGITGLDAGLRTDGNRRLALQILAGNSEKELSRKAFNSIATFIFICEGDDDGRESATEPLSQIMNELFNSEKIDGLDAETGDYWQVFNFTAKDSFPVYVGVGKQKSGRTLLFKIEMTANLSVQYKPEEV